VRYRWIKEHDQAFPVSAMCRALRVRRSGFYAWRKNPLGRHARRRRELIDPIRRAFVQSRATYGSPRVARQLRAEGIRVCENTVARCMKEQGIKAKTGRKFTPRTTESDPSLRASPNLLGRDFAAAAVNQKWCGDITYVATGEGWLYVATIKDLFSKRIVGWAMAAHMREDLTLAALGMAVGRRGPVRGVIHHSDRGKQYASAKYRAMLGTHGIVQSMSGTGDCYDNAPAESFFSSMKKELVNRRRFATREEARLAIFEYIEVFYNQKRLHSSIGYVSPAMFEAAC